MNSTPTKAPVERIRFQLKTRYCFSFTPVHTQTMKMIMKTQTFEYAIQSGSTCKRNEMKAERFENVSVQPGPKCNHPYLKGADGYELHTLWSYVSP